MNYFNKNYSCHAQRLPFVLLRLACFFLKQLDFDLLFKFDIYNIYLYIQSFLR